jgi:mitochondrial cardiolipin hydrolase
MKAEAHFTRTASLAEIIECLLKTVRTSVDAALYRLDNPRLARVLGEVAGSGSQVRVVLDRDKYDESRVTRGFLLEGRIPFRLVGGRKGSGSKMHHKFAIVDERVALIGSYNWTLESEEQNYDNLLILREPQLVKHYHGEFEALWAEAREKPRR